MKRDSREVSDDTPIYNSQELPLRLNLKSWNFATKILLYLKMNSKLKMSAFKNDDKNQRL